MRRNGVKCPRPLEEGGSWSEKVVWKARRSTVPADRGWQDGTLGLRVLGDAVIPITGLRGIKLGAMSEEE